MPTLKSFLMCLLALAALATSCKDDDTAAPIIAAENTFVFEGTTYPLAFAIGEEYDNGDTPSKGYSLAMISETSSESVILLLNVPDGTLEGTYLPATPEGTDEYTFVFAEVNLGCNELHECNASYATSGKPSGTVTITKTEGLYLVDYNVVLNTNKRLVGKFKGSLPTL